MKNSEQPKQRPPRADPLQPDRPGSGQTREDPKQHDPQADVRRQKEQSDTALDNVTKDYD